MALTILFYVKFHQQRYREFTYQWWGWLLATGMGLACTLGCKMVGLFTFMTVGGAVLWDLWEILDIKKGNSMVRAPISSQSPSLTWRHISGVILRIAQLHLSCFPS